MKAPGEILVFFLYWCKDFLEDNFWGAQRSPHSAFRCPPSTVSSDTYICS